MSAQQESHRFHQNRACEYFPCHKGVPEDEFSCLFCYCPLYALGKRCGGNCTYLENGVKSCESCTFPHRAENYDAILARWCEIADVVRREDARNG